MSDEFYFVKGFIFYLMVIVFNVNYFITFDEFNVLVLKLHIFYLIKINNKRVGPTGPAVHQ